MQKYNITDRLSIGIDIESWGLPFYFLWYKDYFISVVFLCFELQYDIYTD